MMILEAGIAKLINTVTRLQIERPRGRAMAQAVIRRPRRGGPDFIPG
jgi:hypothetical protein